MCIVGPHYKTPLKLATFLSKNVFFNLVDQWGREMRDTPYLIYTSIRYDFSAPRVSKNEVRLNF